MKLVARCARKGRGKYKSIPRYSPPQLPTQSQGATFSGFFLCCCRRRCRRRRHYRRCCRRFGRHRLRRWFLLFFNKYPCVFEVLL